MEKDGTCAVECANESDVCAKTNEEDNRNTANVYRQTTDKLMFKSVISTVKWMIKIGYSKVCYQQAKRIDI